MASCKAPTASTSPLREEKSEVCSSMMAVISSERWMPMTETFRHREDISERKAPIWKVRAFSVSARGLLSCPSRSRATNSTASSRAANAPMYRNRRRRMDGCACFSFESKKLGMGLHPPSDVVDFFSEWSRTIPKFPPPARRCPHRLRRARAAPAGAGAGRHRGLRPCRSSPRSAARKWGHSPHA